MAVLTIEVQTVAIYYEYTRCRVTVYASGEISQGETGTIEIRDYQASLVASVDVSAEEQQDGTVQIHTGLYNVTRGIGANGRGEQGGICAVFATLGEAYAEHYEPLQPSVDQKADAIVIYGDDYSGNQKREFGSEIIIAVCSTFIASCNVRLQMGPNYDTLATIVSGKPAKGIYRVTIPMSAISTYCKSSTSVKFAVTTSHTFDTGYSIMRTPTFIATVPDNIVPSIGDISWRDGLLHGYPGDGVIDAFVQRISNVEAWAPATANYGAWISKIMATYGPLSSSIGTSGGASAVSATSENPLELGVINDSGDLELKITVEDSRKRRFTKSVTLKTAQYEYPLVTSVNVERWNTTDNKADDESTTVRVRAAGTLYDCNGKGNTGTLKVYADEAVAEPDYQLKSTTAIAEVFDKSVDHAGFAETTVWRFRWEVTDRFGQVVEGEAIVYAARPTIDVSPDSKSIGFWTTAGGREDVNGNPVDGFYLNGDLTLQEGRAIYGTGGEQENRMDLDKILEFAYNYSTEKFQLNALQNVALANDRYLAGYNAAGSLVRLMGVNASGQAELNWTSGGLKGRVTKKIWSGTLSKGGSATIPELPYYNLIAAQLGTSDELVYSYRPEMVDSAGNWYLGHSEISGNVQGGFWVMGATLQQTSPTKLTLKWAAGYNNTTFYSEYSITAIYGIL